MKVPGDDNDGLWLIGSAIVALVLAGATIGGTFVYLSFKTPKQPTPVMEIKEGCYTRNATVINGIQQAMGTIITVNQPIIGYLGTGSLWPAFVLSQGTYPNGTQWQKLVVSC